ncbi:DUF397 domain-containing protein [Streptomyces sp. NPDC051561]|uniref:DUF397 domain-containing protein n=1 Tax=Streptomyces sp. NPDC051561 TaxID=3365658 RepID=UPI0037A99010
MTTVVPPIWRKSSYSNGTGGECVEFAPSTARTAVRDSKFPDGPFFDVTVGAWGEFVRAVQCGDIAP